MNYLYHRVPENLQGDILYPLNVLKEKFPEIYKEQVSKYAGREFLLREKIPPLNCLWNDVLHFSAVDSREIKKALIEAGSNPNLERSLYQVDPKLLDPKNTVIYLYSENNLINNVNKKDFIPYNPEDMAKFSVMPQMTKNYYRETIAKGEKPLLYHGITHILYKGSLNIKDMPIISV